MMELVRSWLLGVTGVAIFAAMAEGLMPEGPVKRVGKLTGGLVLMVAALTPILSLDLTEFLPYEQWSSELEIATESLDEGRKNQWEVLIVEELETYIVDKAAERDILCTVTVTCRPEGEIYLPDTITITGDLTEEEQTKLCKLVGEDFSISETKIQFIVEEGTD